MKREGLFEKGVGQCVTAAGGGGGGGGEARRGRQTKGKGEKVCHFSRQQRVQKFSSEGLLARGVFASSWPLISPPSSSSSLPGSFSPSPWLNFELPSQISLPLTAVTGLITEQMK